MAKYNWGLGNLQWQNTIGGSADDFAYGVTESSDKGFIIAGTTRSCEGNFSGNHGSSDGLLAKVDAGGKLLWTRIFGNTGNDNLTAVFENEDGSIVAAGTISCLENTNRSGSGFWLLKLNKELKIVWSKSPGGTCDDRLVAAVSTDDGGYILAGNTSSKKVKGFHGKSDGLIVKTDGEGNEEWESIIGGSQNDFITSCARAIDGGWLIGARTSSQDGNLAGLKSSSYTDCWLINLSAKGEIDWQTIVRYEGFNITAATVIETDDGSYFVGGTAMAQLENFPQSFMLKLSPGKVIQWIVFGNGKEFGKAFLRTSEGDIVMASGSFSSSKMRNNKGFEDLFIVKFHSTMLVSKDK